MSVATTVGRAGQTVSGFEHPGESRVVNWALR
jgi:hypothetical protein